MYISRGESEKGPSASLLIHSLISISPLDLYFDIYFKVMLLQGMTHLLSLHQSEFIKALIVVQQERFQKGRPIN